MEKLLEIIKRHWGYDRLWPLQGDVMDGVLNRRDSLVVLPTGGGKSLCFQAPAVAMDGMAVVVSPLISLMKDQVDSLNMCGVSAACINSSLSYDERRKADEALCAGELKLLYVAPERIVASGFIEHLKQTKLSFIAIDEAHCISHWGHDFRPEYRKLCMLREAFPGLAIHAFTATATPHVRDDICKELALNGPEVFVGSFDRPNLVYRAVNRTNKLDQVRSVIDRHRGESGIVYCITRKDVDALCGDLCTAGYKALPYHAGMTDENRKSNQEAFTNEKTDIIVATVAFGMGIDKSNVRYVVHAGMPKSIEHYQQESGRGGRDGLAAECCLFYSGGDFAKWRFLLRNLEGEAAKIALGKLNDMVAYCTGVTCRHEALVSYFDQTLDKDNCGACDICLGEADLVDDALIIGQKILSCVVRLGPVAGPSYTVLVLAGSKEARVLEKGHNTLSTWGILAEHPSRQIRDWLEQLAAQGYLVKTGEFNILEVTPKGRKVLSGDETPRLLKPAAKAKKKKASAAEAKSWQGVDRDLFEILRAKCLEIATERRVPAWMIFDDVALRDMARRQPTTDTAFLEVHAVGQKKAEAFADMFLPLIRDYLAANDMDGDTTPPEPVAPKRKKSNQQETKQKAYLLFDEEYDVSEVAARTGRALSTVNGYLEDYLADTGATDPGRWIDGATFERVCKAVEAVGDSRLKTIHEFLDGQVEYEAIRIAVVCLRNRMTLEG